MDHQASVCAHALRFILFSSLTFLSQTFAAEKLVVVGGGSRPNAANARFIQWAGGASAKILILTWAADGTADEYFSDIQDELVLHSPLEITHGVQKTAVATDRKTLVDQVNAATGIFFTGGTQTYIMDVFDSDEKANPSNPLLNLFRQRYKSGVVFGGTSAGTAIMSTPMLTGIADLTVIDGTKVETRTGFDLIPGVIFDQHFIARGRLPRLMGLMQQNPTRLGLGIDECTAMLVEDSRFAEVVGCSQVLAIQTTGPKGKVEIDPIAAGERYDLVKRARY